MKQKTFISLFVLCIFFLFQYTFAQAFYFGRNKVHYTDFKWQILKTRHFDIYYYPEMQDMAEKGAAFAEESFKILEAKFNYSVTRRIPLIFYSTHLHFEQTNVLPGFIPEGVGGFFEFMKGRVVVPGNGDFRRFRRVIRHELVHVFMHAKLYNLARRYDRAEPAAPPLWFTEGLAEFWSGGWDSQGEMVLKDAVLHNYVVGLQDIVQVRGTYFMYKLGQDILTYISDRYGADKILLLMENFWKYDQFEQSFKETLGLSYRQFDNEYLPYLKKRFYPRLADEDFNAAVCPTIVRDGYNFKPVYYKSGGKEYVISTGNRDGYSSIYQSPLHPLTPDQKDKRKRIIKGEASPEFEAFHLFSSKIDVSKAGILTFSAKSGASDVLYLYDINADTMSASLRFDGIVGITSPNWSADGSEITFSGLSSGGQLDIYTYHTIQKKLTRLTNDFYANYDAVFSPDGKYIAFSSDRSAPGKKGALNLVLMQAQVKVGTQMTRRVKSLTEIVGIDPDTNELITNAVYVWNPADDTFNYSGHSYIYEQIAITKGWSQRDMMREVKRRTRLLLYLKSQKVSYKNVARYVSAYYTDPDRVMKSAFTPPSSLRSTSVRTSPRGTYSLRTSVLFVVLPS